MSTLDSLLNAAEESLIKIFYVFYIILFSYFLFEKSNIKRHQAPQLFTVSNILCKNTNNEITIDSLWIKMFSDINVFFLRGKVLVVDALAGITGVIPAIHM
ncbi:hypothetical protein AB4K20DRAFT_1863328 [Rhizopus microsporus]|uniref:Uncharacterized protein n=1 Tax=Rhizopus microsporus TaxID=58291 RepID=A0A1X0S1L8_RHIZD|nr:hypothetical protein BCV71DRAFT_235237 [Rhizopus microsporus]